MAVPTTPMEAALALCRGLGVVVKSLETLTHEVRGLRADVQAMSNGPAAPAASDRELDGKYGNPQVKFAPRGYAGPVVSLPAPMSECPIEMLEEIASLNDWKAENPKKGATQEEAEKQTKFARLDAARARGWIRRIRSGWKPAKTTSDPPPSDRERHDEQHGDDGGW